MCFHDLGKQYLLKPITKDSKQLKNKTTNKQNNWKNQQYSQNIWTEYLDTCSLSDDSCYNVYSVALWWIKIYQAQEEKNQARNTSSFGTSFVEKTKESSVPAPGPSATPLSHNHKARSGSASNWSTVSIIR